MNIGKYFPEVDRIKDENLKTKINEVWNDALRLGGWEESELEEIPFSLLAGDTDISLITHTRAVTDIAIKIAEVLEDYYGEKLSIDFDILIAGGLLHDVGKLLEYGRGNGGYVKSSEGKYLRHPFSGTSLAFAHNLPVEIQHIIAVHSHEGDKGFRSVEAIIINHADFVNFDPWVMMKRY